MPETVVIEATVGSVAGIADNGKQVLVIAPDHPRAEQIAKYIRGTMRAYGSHELSAEADGVLKVWEAARKPAAPAASEAVA